MASVNAVTPSPVSDLRTFVEKQSGQRVLDCYQCGKCSAGCPVDYAMDLGPRQVMRYIQMGLKKEVMQSTTIWLCIGCETCSSRCPAKIDIARVMESLRILAAAEGTTASEKQIDLFHRTFLDTIRRYGRAHEFSLAAAYTLKSRNFFGNLDAAQTMFSKGKLVIIPPKVEGAAWVKTVFSKTGNVRPEVSTTVKAESGH
ncbi:MAG: 4Fe-4S dicluster domain-containing protein [Dehalococcoidia bacterium]|nr:4Fe-4S dicluster domain-containing protein [Dehalococcoidia bacterium]